MFVAVNLALYTAPSPAPEFFVVFYGNLKITIFMQNSHLYVNLANVNFYFFSI